ncbi:putative quinol monooxygenase [Luteimonas soli]|uniref:Quinol monooxygenase n=1 Tax=Luteimonas soli TaxID=1648966 RepID=A0ABV7XPL2_9GAMM
MARLAVLVNIEAKSGKEAEVEALLLGALPLGALPLARAEAGTRSWYAFKSGPSTFGIFDTFDSEAGPHAHLEGEVARLLLERTEELLARPPQVTSVDLLAAK